MGKRAADVVVGMLSDVGSSTRAAAPSVTEAFARPPAPVASPATAPPLPVPPQPSAPPVSREPARSAPGSASVASASSPATGEPVIPRTLRLRTGTAGQLRAAWLLAKREDVLLTAQDFASDLVEEALRSRQRRQRAASGAV